MMFGRASGASVDLAAAGPENAGSASAARTATAAVALAVALFSAPRLINAHLPVGSSS